MNLTNIRARIITVLEGVSGIAKAYDYEPDQSAKSPYATVSYREFAEDIHSMSTAKLVAHQWNLRLYITLTSGERAEDSLLSLLPAILEAFKSEKTLNNTCLDANIISGGPVGYIMDSPTPQMVIPMILVTKETT